jgi:hypothetical protein
MATLITRQTLPPPPFPQPSLAEISTWPTPHFLSLFSLVLSTEMFANNDFFYLHWPQLIHCKLGHVGKIKWLTEIAILFVLYLKLM